MWFQRGRLQLDDLKFSEKIQNKYTYRMAKKTTDRPFLRYLIAKLEENALALIEIWRIVWQFVDFWFLTFLI